MRVLIIGIAGFAGRYLARELEGLLEKVLQNDEEMKALSSQLGLGKLYHRTGKAKEAGEARATAHSMFRDMDMAFWLRQVGDW